MIKFGLPGKTIRVFIADDSNVSRKAVREYLEQTKNFSIVGESSSGKDVVEMVNKSNADIALLDVVMDERSGIEITRDMITAGSSAKVVLFTAHDYPRLFEQGIQVGAHAIVLKSIGMPDLAEGLKRIHENKPWEHPLALVRKLPGA